MGKGGGRADRERTAWMEINKAGILNVSKNIWAAISRFARGLRGASVNSTGCCQHSSTGRVKESAFVQLNRKSSRKLIDFNAHSRKGSLRHSTPLSFLKFRLDPQTCQKANGHIVWSIFNLVGKSLPPQLESLVLQYIRSSISSPYPPSPSQSHALEDTLSLITPLTLAPWALWMYLLLLTLQALVGALAGRQTPRSMFSVCPPRRSRLL